MKIKLVKDARVMHKAGEVVDTIPSYARILLANGMAIPFIEEEKKEAKPKTRKKKAEE